MIQIAIMKISLNILSLCVSIPELVGDSTEKFVQKRQKKHLERAAKRQKILAAILKKPKKFFGISDDMIFKFVTKQEFRTNVRTAVKDLTNSKCQNLIETTVIEFEDERILRGYLLSTRLKFKISI